MSQMLPTMSRPIAGSILSLRGRPKVTFGHKMTEATLSLIGKAIVGLGVIAE